MLLVISLEVSQKNELRKTTALDYANNLFNK